MSLARPTQLEVDLAFTGAVRPEVQRLFALAYSILRDRNEAEDAVQETMVLAWKAWSTLRDRDHPGPWLAKICVNHCLRRRHLLTNRWRTMNTREEDAMARTAAPVQGRMIDLDRAYLKLSVQQRAVVVLTYHYGYTVVEAAELMGCAAGTARSHLARALTTLRKELGDA
jgi:RNA polymerase sigma factor (sigma-70 family)